MLAKANRLAIVGFNSNTKTLNLSYHNFNDLGRIMNIVFISKISLKHKGSDNVKIKIFLKRKWQA
jgi:hypothetical protein